MCAECNIERWAFSNVIGAAIAIGRRQATIIQIIDTSIVTTTIHCIAIILLMHWT